MGTTYAIHTPKIEYAQDETHSLRVGPIVDDDGDRVDLTNARVDIAVRLSRSRTSAALFQLSTENAGEIVIDDQSDVVSEEEGRGYLSGVILAAHTASKYTGWGDVYVTLDLSTPIQIELTDEGDRYFAFIVHDGLSLPNA